MPQIKQYEQQVAVAGPQGTQQATGEDFGSNVGQSQAQFGGAVGQAGEVLSNAATRSDISDLYSNMADAKDQLELQRTDQLQKGTLNHDDFMESVNDAMDKIGQGVNTGPGQRRFQQLQADTKLQFSQQAQLGQAQLAGEKAVQDYKMFVDKNSSTLESNPALFSSSLAQKDQFIDDLVATKGLPANKAAELKTEAMTEFAKSAVRGVMNLNPDLAQHQLDSGVWDSYMNGDVKYKMAIETERAQRARLIDDGRQQKLIRDAATEQQEKTVQGFYSQMHNGGPPPTSKDVLSAMQGGKIDSGTAEMLWKQLDANNSEKKLKSDPATYEDLQSKLYLPDGDPNKITDQGPILKAASQLKLSVPDTNLLLGALADKNTPQGNADAMNKKNYMDTVKNTLIKNPLMPDPEGMRINQQVQAQSMEYALKAAQNGKTQSQIWAPTLGGKPNEDYVGNHVPIPTRSMQDIIQSKMNAMDPMVPVISPDGKTGKIPSSKLDDYIKTKGFKKVGG